MKAQIYLMKIYHELYNYNFSSFFYLNMIHFYFYYLFSKDIIFEANFIKYFTYLAQSEPQTDCENMKKMEYRVDF